ncbi:ribonuclease T [Buchnera aphidicola]|uniref:Ribonuclease T n=1 Tax=Buchnera aphidicola subsp. Cinara cedri (strain Cc) TaxID=372461 RepID=RNT_BUCCC|nr:ribonuclease T [Buchnera aphidicola]Q057V1.1 RecName: Full=Ribonuclease T; AltName: Full=Exoribonuclease T; Short=RNase T [Buchnera aphidicola BCc]ABJ90598.1 exoribonuclease T [Buchnera aphidicola BCc]
MFIYKDINYAINNRFRGFYPVVIDIESAGFQADTDALLEIAIVTLKMNKSGWLKIDDRLHFHIIPFKGSIIKAESVAFNKIDPFNPLRGAVSEKNALKNIFKLVRKKININKCRKGILVAHNANFDHNFLMAASKRVGNLNNPFHPFTTFDTAALSGLIFGQTVLAKACKLAGIPFDTNQAHSALYDTIQTAYLFCELVNRWKRLGGWPPNSSHRKKTDEI